MPREPRPLHPKDVVEPRGSNVLQVDGVNIPTLLRVLLQESGHLHLQTNTYSLPHSTSVETGECCPLSTHDGGRQDPGKVCATASASLRT
eukprot:1386502-Rhodomonas_salina.3